MECSRMRLSVSTPSTSISTSRILAARFTSADEIFRVRWGTTFPSAPRLPRDVCGGNQREAGLTNEGPEAVWPWGPAMAVPGAEIRIVQGARGDGGARHPRRTEEGRVGEEGRSRWAP